MRRVLDWAANDVPLLVWLGVVTLLLLVLTGGCARPAPPPVFASAPPALQAPPSPVVVVGPDDCLEARAMQPAQRAPYVDARGVAECRAQVVPEPQVREMLADGVAATYWRELAEMERAYREADRASCEAEALRRLEYGLAMRREAQGARWAGVGLGVGGLVAGLALGLGAATVAP